MAEEKKPTSRMELILGIESNLTTLLEDKIKACPATFNKTRFVQNAITVLADTKNIELCTQGSIIRTLLKGAFLDLDFFRRECYAIPYNTNIGSQSQPKYEYRCTFQTDYKGEIKLVKKYGVNIKNVYAMLVREGDDLRVGVDHGNPFLDFIPEVFNEKKIVGAFAVLIFNDGFVKYDTMATAEIEHIRTVYSKAADSKAWKNSWGEMAKKSILHRLLKTEDLHFDNREQETAFHGATMPSITGAGEVKKLTKITTPFDAPETPDAENAVIVDSCNEDRIEAIKEKLRDEFPTEEDWQITARAKEIIEAEDKKGGVKSAAKSK